MSSMLPRSRKAGLSNLAEWLEGAWPFGEHNLVRIEESAGAGKYTVRAELPGFDPEKGIHVTVEGSMLTIAAEREAGKEEKGRSEFRYGSFQRTVKLPEGADPGKVTAKYTNGILEVTVPCEAGAPGRQVDIPIAQE
ncbi:MAG TPA: Hsp20/alpha crystallin family protein [Amycolatopsis sp.]|uniref:Hsp20/alpha crystallin family protein n=1 Tax=Amycolatopsis sp. TaxID=37632 RepID=UPI002B463711|nr:Hsp20/alpha crystallin family protein [Amycolatopsis sp.]HKS49660.1 Hsp20/alpha crystallin family protein [Amycolatopsis sp.]